ncbi:ABC transporter permease [Myxosarcina sp. GI1]|uniref:ABC transporter permease n=1 Tax=Myxosarcina sp. GI1 TaxID=1541065 RepID=UPI00055CD2DF|nr:ABC transporter permease [Myxosarcina sp. GI1]
MVLSTANNKSNRQLRWYWELAIVLIDRNLQRRYRGSVLGIYWSLFNPLIMTGLYTAIFGATFASYYNNSTLNYVLAAFTGLIVINFFSSSTAQALASVVENGAIVNKIRLPLFIFPLSTIGANIFQLIMGALPLLIIVTLIISRNPINSLALCLPIAALTLVCTGVGLLMSALYVFFRDLSYFYELLTFLLWIGSPVFYPADIVPEAVRKFLILNPLLPIIESIRQISLSGSLPDLVLIFQAFLSGTIVLVIGIVAFYSRQSQFIDLL